MTTTYPILWAAAKVVLSEKIHNYQCFYQKKVTSEYVLSFYLQNLKAVAKQTQNEWKKKPYSMDMKLWNLKN